MTNSNLKVAGYVKLAKLWERSAEQAIAYHHLYYEDKYRNNNDITLVDVYIDITGQKQIYSRPGMLRLLKDCEDGKIDCIATQTKGYLAANTRDLCYLIMMLHNMPNRIGIVTEDINYRINTITNVDNQYEALVKMAQEYIAIDRNAYEAWLIKVRNAIEKL